MVNFRNSLSDGPDSSPGSFSGASIDLAIWKGPAQDAWMSKTAASPSGDNPQVILVNEYTRMPKPPVFVPNVQDSQVTPAAPAVQGDQPQAPILGAPSLPNIVNQAQSGSDGSAAINPKDWVNQSPSDALQTLASQPTTYNPNATYGSDPSSHTGDDFAKIVGGVLGWRAIEHRWHGRIPLKTERNFEFAEPEFTKTPLISEAQIDAVNKAVREAHEFLSAEHENLEATDRSELKPKEIRDLDARLQEIEIAIHKTEPGKMKGHAHLRRVFDTSEPLRKNPEIWENLAPLEKAQDELIRAREDGVRELKLQKLTEYNDKARAHNLARLGDFGVLGGALAINYEIDSLFPSNKVSTETILGDLAMPLVMGIEMTPLFKGCGKFASLAEPLVKGALIVGTHAITHFGFDSKKSDYQTQLGGADNGLAGSGNQFSTSSD